MKLKRLILGSAIAGVIAVTAGGVVLAADNDSCNGTCVQGQERNWERVCSETCNRLRNCNCELGVETNAAGENEGNQNGNSWGQPGGGTGPGLNREWGKNAH